MKTCLRRVAGRILAGTFLAALLPRADAAYLILKNGDKVPAKQITVRINGDAIVYRADGVKQTFPKNAYKAAVGDKPAQWDQAMQMIKGKQYDEVVPLLDTIIKENFGLQWDGQAAGMKGRVLLDTGKAEAAVATFERLFSDSPQMMNGDVLSSYLQALIQVKNFSKLDNILKKAIGSPNREDAALAHIVKGDMKLAQGDPQSAVLEYLVTALMFTKEDKYQAEANFKAGQVLEQLRDARAKERYQAAVDADPESSWGQKAKQKL